MEGIITRVRNGRYYWYVKSTAKQRIILLVTLKCEIIIVLSNICFLNIATAIFYFHLLVLVHYTVIAFYIFCFIFGINSLLLFYSYRSTNYRQLLLFLTFEGKVFHQFSLSPMRARNRSNYCYFNSWRRYYYIGSNIEIKEVAIKQRTKNEAKRLRDTTFVIAKLEEQFWNNYHFDSKPKIISHFWGKNNILVDCRAQQGLILVICFILCITG